MHKITSLSLFLSIACTLTHASQPEKPIDKLSPSSEKKLPGTPSVFAATLIGTSAGGYAGMEATKEALKCWREPRRLTNAKEEILKCWHEPKRLIAPKKEVPTKRLLEFLIAYKGQETTSPVRFNDEEAELCEAILFKLRQIVRNDNALCHDLPDMPPRSSEAAFNDYISKLVKCKDAQDVEAAEIPRFTLPEGDSTISRHFRDLCDRIQPAMKENHISNLYDKIHPQYLIAARLKDKSEESLVTAKLFELGMTTEAQPEQTILQKIAKPCAALAIAFPALRYAVGAFALLSRHNMVTQ